MRPKLNLVKFLRQLFCWHSLTCAEGPDQPPIHYYCSKCDWEYTDWQAEADYYHNYAAKWYGKYIELKGEDSQP